MNREADIQIQNGCLIDGIGSPSFIGCLNIKGDRILSIGGSKGAADRVIDAAGKVVCPGFIDIHSHGDFAIVNPKEMEACVYQGVTTIVTGNCGFSAFPIEERMQQDVLKYSSHIMGTPQGDMELKDFSHYRKWLDCHSIPLNLVSLVGHRMLHLKVMGNREQEPTQSELQSMGSLLEHQLKQGAAGLSLGLAYAPGACASAEEIRYLAQITAKHNKIMAVHLKDEGKELLESMEEMLTISKETGVHLHFSHHKVMGRKYWGKSDASLKRIRRAKKEGQEVTLDAYPYDAAASTALVLLPPWLQRKETEQILELLGNREIYERVKTEISSGIKGWENLGDTCGFERLSFSHMGHSIAQEAQRRGCEPLECLFQVLKETDGSAAVVIRGMWEQDVERILCDENTLIGSDSLYPGAAHPRKYGSFARMAAEYAFGTKGLRPEMVIAKMTGLTARALRLQHRGVLKPGNYADVIVFDPNKFRDRADFLHPGIPAGHMDYVLINGKMVLEQGGIHRENFGRVLCT